MKLAEVAYFTDRVGEMADFYRRLLGIDPVASSDSMAIFLSGETKIFIHSNYVPQTGELPPENHHAFSVEDVDALCREVLAAGLRLEIAPQDFYWGRSAYLRDPDGHLIEITQKEE